MIIVLFVNIMYTLVYDVRSVYIYIYIYIYIYTTYIILDDYRYYCDFKMLFNLLIT